MIILGLLQAYQYNRNKRKKPCKVKILHSKLQLRLVISKGAAFVKIALNQGFNFVINKDTAPCLPCPCLFAWYLVLACSEKH